MSKSSHFHQLLIASTLFFALWCSLSLQPVASAEQQQHTLHTVYVPAYSHIYILDSREYPLAVTLTIRNIDLQEKIVIKSIRYFDSAGKLLQVYSIPSPVLGPLGSTEVHVTEKDLRGGIGASFLVTWHAESKALRNPPLIESIMAGTRAQQGISFSSRGVPIERSAPKTE